MKSKYTKSERATLRQLAEEAWRAELDEALMGLYDDFGKWAEDTIGPFELSDRIHEFHNGIARDLHSRYTNLEASTLVARAVALGLIGKKSLDSPLLRKLGSEIEFFRENGR